MFDTAFTAEAQRQAADAGNAKLRAELVQTIQSTIESCSRAGKKYGSVPTPRTRYGSELVEEARRCLDARGFTTREMGQADSLELQIWWR